MQLTITLPLPHKYLRPNSRVKWQITFGITKQARERAKRAAFVEFQKIESPVWILRRIHYKAYFRTKRMWDRSNLIMAAKSVEDGIADAANQNDVHFEDPIVERFTDTKNPRLEIILEVEELI